MRTHNFGERLHRLGIQHAFIEKALFHLYGIFLPPVVNVQIFAENDKEFSGVQGGNEGGFFLHFHEFGRLFFLPRFLEGGRGEQLFFFRQRAEFEFVEFFFQRGGKGLHEPHFIEVERNIAVGFYGGESAG